MSDTLALLFATLGTYGLRLLGTIGGRRRALTPRTDRILHHAAIAILAAMSAATVPDNAGSTGNTLAVVAGLVATTVAARRVSGTAATVAIGVFTTAITASLVP